LGAQIGGIPRHKPVTLICLSFDRPAWGRLAIAGRPVVLLAIRLGADDAAPAK
jgi:hypothetical protein